VGLYYLYHLELIKLRSEKVLWYRGLMMMIMIMTIIMIKITITHFSIREPKEFFVRINIIMNRGKAS
jgi:hypothetical protein